ncbi:MAG: hypothetical protein K2X39_10565, partial [Silvanigrellaceae bacterium]|nr:hypothetical protein [Silvanigrellaceae bacterium]
MKVIFVKFFLFVTLIFGLLIINHLYGYPKFISFELMRSELDSFQQEYFQNPIKFFTLFFVLYVF